MIFTKNWTIHIYRGGLKYTPSIYCIASVNALFTKVEILTVPLFKLVYEGEQWR
jgi:hypothetical protein